MMNNIGNNKFGIKFESDSSASSMMGGSVSNNASFSHIRQGAASNYDATAAAVAKLGSIMDGQRGALAVMSFLKRKPGSPPSSVMESDLGSSKKNKPLTNE